jgi:Co/Zn/Cd efflux system component
LPRLRRPARRTERRTARHGHPALAITLAVNGTFLVVEVIGGWLTNSLALFADGGRTATDVAARTVAPRGLGGKATDVGAALLR